MPDDPTPLYLTPDELRELARRAREWAEWYRGEIEADRQMAEVRKVISLLPKATGAVAGLPKEQVVLEAFLGEPERN